MQKLTKAILDLSPFQKMAIAIIALAILAGCGGGGGGGTSLPSGGGTLPTMTPTSMPTSGPASVAGTVIDEQSSSALAGVQVALSPWVTGATPSPVATTNASGQFSFTTTAGSYMVTIGSNSPTDTRATLHFGVVLAAGSNTLTLPTPSAYAGVTYTSAQTNGSLRLMALSATQQDCLTGANAGRSANSLPLLVPDEFLEENAIAVNAQEDAQATDQPTPLFGYTQPFGSISGLATSFGFDPCDLWTDGYSYTSGNPPYTAATTSSNVWYGADVDETNAPHYGAQMWETNIVGVGMASKSRR
jgi:hypothetical protein